MFQVVYNPAQGFVLIQPAGSDIPKGYHLIGQRLIQPWEIEDFLETAGVRANQVKLEPWAGQIRLPIPDSEYDAVTQLPKGKIAQPFER